MKRVIYFILTNMAIMFMLSIVLFVVLPLLGINIQGTGGILIISAVFGMGGSFISLQMSRWMAKRATGAKVIEQASNSNEKWLLDTVHRLADKAGIPHPEVAYYDSPEINAFATGPSKSKSLVAVSTGLLVQMGEKETEAVLAHEISHIANGDMVTMALLQGVMNTFVFFFARLVANVVNNVMSDNGKGMGIFAYYAVVMVMEVIFGIAASVVVMAFSRYREYGADKGAAELVGANGMVAALEQLKGQQESNLEGQLVAFGINGKRSQLFASHPSLDQRIRRLRS